MKHILAITILLFSGCSPQDPLMPPGYKLICNGEQYAYKTDAGYRSPYSISDTRDMAIYRAWKFYNYLKEPILEPSWEGWHDCPGHNVVNN